MLRCRSTLARYLPAAGSITRIPSGYFSRQPKVKYIFPSLTVPPCVKSMSNGSSFWSIISPYESVRSPERGSGSLKTVTIYLLSLQYFRNSAVVRYLAEKM